MRFFQTEVDANGMHLYPSNACIQSTMQQPSLFNAVKRNIKVAPFRYVEPAQQSVPMMTIGIDRIFSIGVKRHKTVREKLVLWHGGPMSFIGYRPLPVFSQHLLQKNNIGFG